MKARVTRRRDNGAVLPQPVPVVEGASLLEVVVVEITEQGNRRPVKVARLQPIGERRILAQLKLPKLVKFVGWTMVLSGIEEFRDSYQNTRGVAQTWVCELFTQPEVVGFRVRDAYEQGRRISGSVFRNTSGSRGTMAIDGEYSAALQRHTTCAKFRSHPSSTAPEKRLVDCYVEFMAETSFELGGLCVRDAHQDRPERIERGGWLCEFDIKERELSKYEARMLR